MTPRVFRWRVARQCANCPFAKQGAGLQLRQSLARGRWREILTSLRRGDHFNCHKTTTETGNGTNLMCAGALGWQNSRGIFGQMQRIGERLEAMSNAKRHAADDQP